MGEVLYTTNSLLIALLLFVAMLLAIEAGYRIARRQGETVPSAIQDHIGAIVGSLLGLLALLLAFSFSSAMDRYEKRNEALVEEANAIGTTYLRASLLPSAFRAEARRLLQRHTDLRVQSSGVALDRGEERQALLADANRVLDLLWAGAVRAAELEPNPVTTGLYVQALNETIDALGRREASLVRHVPQVILLLLFASFVTTCGAVGYAAGVAGHRPTPVSYILVLLIVLVCFIVIDLDRPRRGVIRTDRTSLLQLKATIDQAQAAAPALPPAAPRP